MKRSGFSMIELVFVIVILGVLAAVAVPRFVTTRVDAQIAVARSDIASALKAIPAAVFAYNLDTTQSAPPAGYNKDEQGNTFSAWGQWMIHISQLSRDKFIAFGNGISPVFKDSSNNGIFMPCDPSYKGIYITDNTDTINGAGQLVFDPSQFDKGTIQNSFCQGLAATYPSGSRRLIPLVPEGKVSVH